MPVAYLTKFKINSENTKLSLFSKRKVVVPAADNMLDLLRRHYE